MPHGLGSPGDFGQRPEFVDHGEPEGENIKRLEDLIDDDMNNLGPEADDAPDVHDDPSWSEESAARFGEAAEDEAVELVPISVEELQSMILGPNKPAESYSGFVREYYMAPEQLVVLVHHEIIDRDEARNYLRSQGVELFG